MFYLFLIWIVFGLIYFMITMDDYIDKAELNKKIIYYVAVGPLGWIVIGYMKLHEWIMKNDEPF